MPRPKRAPGGLFISVRVTGKFLDRLEAENPGIDRNDKLEVGMAVEQLLLTLSNGNEVQFADAESTDEDGE